MPTSVAHHTWLPVNPTYGWKKNTHSRYFVFLIEVEMVIPQRACIVPPVQGSQRATGLEVCPHTQLQPPVSPFGLCSAWCSLKHLTNTLPKDGHKTELHDVEYLYKPYRESCNVTLANLVFSHLAFTGTWLREGNVFSLSTVHPYGNCHLVLICSNTSV